VTKLRIEGEVDAPGALGFDELAELAEQIDDVGALVPGRKGGAVRLRTLFAAVRVRPTAQWVTLGAADGSFAISVPHDAIAERGLLVYRLGDGTLPSTSGGPLRVLIVDASECGGHELDTCASVKDLGIIRLTAEREPDVGHIHR